ncbi:hypothetical protein Micbo1qcDRAFT_206543 [Microdochium bolleyi]|uniref:Uncharacterized protein n=1 Tax=Microdochium bolleyi TaxID=196109 RepID=A0A136IVM5_9PEZI|nr:hypothetical protein Micbo1qcDRAFT_206543 [Microdochium bolleyi]
MATSIFSSTIAWLIPSGEKGWATKAIGRSTATASMHGTTVWYDVYTHGTRRAYTCLLSSGFSYDFPSVGGKIIIDIQGIRLHGAVASQRIQLPVLVKYAVAVDED